MGLFTARPELLRDLHSGDEKLFELLFDIVEPWIKMPYAMSLDFWDIYDSKGDGSIDDEPLLTLQEAQEVAALLRRDNTGGRPRKTSARSMYLYFIMQLKLWVGSRSFSSLAVSPSQSFFDTPHGPSITQ